MKKELENEIRDQKGLVDDYLGSVMGLYAFAESACWDEQTRSRLPSSEISIPRTMSYTENGEVANLTPDAVVQVTKDYGVVAEMKKHYNSSEKTIYIDQVKKYDRDLLGWWTESEQIGKHDLVLLTHYFSSTHATDAYRLWLTEGNSFQRKFAIIEFSHSDAAQQYFVLKRVVGELSDKDHDEQLRQGKKIPESIINEVISKYKFYDGQPPLMHMLILTYCYTLPLDK